MAGANIGKKMCEERNSDEEKRRCGLARSFRKWSGASDRKRDGLAAMIAQAG